MKLHVQSALFGAALVAATVSLASHASAQTLTGTSFKTKIGTNGEINSLQITGDAFATNYVLNGTNGPAAFATSADHEWVGELMFKYRIGTGAWTTALTSQSSDARTITSTATSVTVTYQNSKNAQGISNFKVVETYSLVDNYLNWQIAVTNAGAQPIEIGDFGLPL